MVRADVRVTVDRRRVDPRSVRVVADFSPFVIVGRTRIRREALGRVTVVRYTYRIQCVAAECSHAGAQARVLLPPARVTWGTPVHRAIVAWPVATVASHLSFADAASPSLHFATTASANRYRVDPNLLGWSSIALAVAIVLAIGSATVVRLKTRGVEPVESSTALERALARLESAASGSHAERRAAIGALAKTLESDGFAELAPLARRLAWSSGGPTPAVATELAGLVRAAVEVAA